MDSHNQAENKFKSTREKGTEAEDKAVDILVNKGYKIIHRNFTYGRVGEIDIVAKEGETLVFVEVRSRKTKDYGSPLESVSPKKQRVLRKVAEGYYYINKLNDVESRFDIIAIDYSENPPIIEHLIDAIW
ncbi:MAG: YraN family protein [Ignavibacteriae bacterium]|nr:YraN family protein [Ignavibacteriota bacterium]